MQVRLGLNLIRLYAVLSASFIPTASETMLSSMNTTDNSWPTDISAALEMLPAGHAFTVPESVKNGPNVSQERATSPAAFQAIRTSQAPMRSRRTRCG